MAGAQINVTQSTDVPNATFTYSANMALASNVTSGNMIECAFRSWQELYNVKHLTGKFVTVSFWYKSSIAGTHKVRFCSYGATVSGGTGGGDVTNTFTVNVANTWQYVSVVMNTLVTLSSWGTTALNGPATFMDIGFQNGTALLSTDYFRITGVQVEAGTIATPFSRCGGDIAGEISKCQRYYYRRYSEVTGGTLVSSGAAYSTTQALLSQPHPVQMRAIPSSINFSGIPTLIQSNGNRTAGITSISNNGTTSSNLSISATIGSAQLTAGNSTYMCGGGSSTTDYIEVSADL
jgi:hypothetical protein